MTRRAARIVVTALVLAGLLSMLVPVSALAAGPRYDITVNPVMELLAGVQAQTDWMKTAGPSGGGSEYFKALKAFFAPYKDDEAVRASADLLSRGFSFDAPAAFVCHLGPLPDLDLKYEYSDYLIQRAHGRDNLERLRLALKDLAAKSGFQSFLDKWQPNYEKWANKAVDGFDGDRLIDWLEQFAGQSGGEFHFILAPAMFPGGGYGATIFTPGGDRIAYQIIRDSSNGSAGPLFPGGRDLSELALHEWGHSFINASLDAHQDRYSEINRFYRPVAAEMKKQAYGSADTYFREQVLRAVTTVAMGELYGDGAASESIADNENRSFLMTGQIASYIRQEYLPNRGKYPTFESFVPALYDWLQAQKAPGPAWLPRGWTGVLAAAGILALAFAVFRRIRGVRT